MIVSFGLTRAGSLAAAYEDPVRLQHASGLRVLEPRLQAGELEALRLEMVDDLAPQRVALVQVHERQLGLHAGDAVQMAAGAAQHMQLEALDVELEKRPLRRPDDVVPDRVEPRGPDALAAHVRRLRGA